MTIQEIANGCVLKISKLPEAFSKSTTIQFRITKVPNEDYKELIGHTLSAITVTLSKEDVEKACQNSLVSFLERTYIKNEIFVGMEIRGGKK